MVILCLPYTIGDYLSNDIKTEPISIEDEHLLMQKKKLKKKSNIIKIKW